MLSKRVEKLERAIYPEPPPVYVVCGSDEIRYRLGTVRFDTLADVERAFPGRRIVVTKVRISDELLEEI